MSAILAKPGFRSGRRLRSIVPPPEPLHSLIATLQGDVNPQAGSLLFSTLPPELRDAIFRLVLTSYDDESAPYPENNHYNRPGYRFRHRIDTALLLTCRRIYREAHLLPVSLNEHVFWASSGRGPPGVRYCDNPINQFSRMTVEQSEAVKDVHLFTQMFWLEGSFPLLCISDLFRMKHLKITIRHGDWWNWEANAPLVMKNGWTANLKAITNLETFEVELETMERDKSQLETIVKSMQSWRIKLENDRVLTTDGNSVIHRRYIGPSNYGGLHYDIQTNSWRSVQQLHLVPRVTSTTGGQFQRRLGSQATTPAQPLYYVGYILLWAPKTV